MLEVRAESIAEIPPMSSMLSDAFLTISLRSYYPTSCHRNLGENTRTVADRLLVQILGSFYVILQLIQQCHENDLHSDNLLYFGID